LPYPKEDHIRWARAALSHYPLEIKELKFLGHSDNLTFRVEAVDDSLYLLRLHDPVTAYYQGMRQLPAAISSELAWMEALHHEGGVIVQRPVRSTAGELSVQVLVEQDRLVPCTLLTWLEGAHFPPTAPDANLLIEHFGGLVARMHNFSAHWLPQQELARPRYDSDHFRRIFARLLRGVDLGIFSEAAYRVLRSVARQVTGEIDLLPYGPDDWGMIHADLHVGNFLINGQEIIPIDFSFCGYGHYLYDISVCLTGGLKPDMRQAFLHGYRSLRAIPEDNSRIIDAFALTSQLSYYAHLIEHPTEHKWLQAHLPQTVDNECRRFLRGEDLLEIR
jgi:Ser/Thr protein kinase RdoA (MazF antagonist)